MKKCFNNVQTLKSSEDCDKYSKSVSYETLVAGTATIGRECGEALEIEGVITRRTLVRRGYLPEQGTHANKESLFASVTCLMRIPRRIQRMLLRMTIPTLAFIFTLATTSESSAETWDCGKIANTVSCSLDENGVFTISGTGKMKDYRVTASGYSNSPWGSANIQTVVVGTGVTSIGQMAFWNASSLTSITIPDSVTSIGGWAFNNAYRLTSITIPDSVTSIGSFAFQGAGLTSITIPDSVTSIGNQAFRGASSLTSITIPDNIDTKNWDAGVFGYLSGKTKNIVCQGDLNICYEKLEKYLTNCPQNLIDAGISCSCSGSLNCIDSKHVTEATQEQCGGEYIWNENSTPKCRHMTDNECANSAQYYINNNGQCKSMPGSKTTCKNADFLWSGSSCVKSCASGFVEWDKECLSEYPFAKKRWTPAEANQWLKDGNDNFVILTFKK